MTITAYRGFLAFLGFFLLVLTPGAADAFCVLNKTTVALHVRALDSSPFNTDIEPGSEACCSPDGCVKRGKDMTPLLVMGGFVPVRKGNRPGWDSECRARVSRGGTVRVTGDINKIICHVGGAAGPGSGKRRARQPLPPHLR
ncbi:MAG: hypothetical protein HQL52_00925 [Magnetococcales bacterium]|nr:hypothetical protein [Magnetococcales bacterium]